MGSHRPAHSNRAHRARRAKTPRPAKLRTAKAARTSGQRANDLRDRRLEVQRTRLFEALGIVQVSRHALDSQLLGLDEISVINALQVACRLVDDVASALAGDRFMEADSNHVAPSLAQTNQSVSQP